MNSVGAASGRLSDLQSSLKPVVDLVDDPLPGLPDHPLVDADTQPFRNSFCSYTVYSEEDFEDTLSVCEAGMANRKSLCLAKSIA